MMMMPRQHTMTLVVLLVVVVVAVMLATPATARPGKKGRDSASTEKHKPSASSMEDNGDHSHQDKAEKKAAKEQEQAYKDLFKCKYHILHYS